MSTFRNPVLTGCHPDPSVCRVGDDYYLVTSTFEYFPGLPVFHSTDLVTWHLIGHAVQRVDQLDLAAVRSSDGLFAATIRHHDGCFYIACTLVGGKGRGGTFMLTSMDPRGPWSDPVWLADAPGIDPSLFFDRDGRAWYVGTRLAEPGEWEGQTQVWLRELDLARHVLTGPEHVIWHGALIGAVWSEGPHVYEVDGTYYLLTAEGGTGHQHAVCVARAASVTGPFTGNPANPVLTHRHLGGDFPVVGVGHADLVQTAAGDWWAVALGSRPYGGYYPNLGRETFLMPVRWESGWPVFAPGVGHVAGDFEAPYTRVPALVAEAPPGRDDFDGPTLSSTWNQLRTGSPFWSLEDRPGWLRMRLLKPTLADVATPAFLGRRQQHMDAVASARLDVRPATSREWAGLAVRQSEDDHCLLVIAGDDRDGRQVLAVQRRAGHQEILARAPIGSGDLTLTVRASGQEYLLEYGQGETSQRLASFHGGFLSSPVAGGFLGLWVGLYGTSNGEPSGGFVDFDWFEYTGSSKVAAPAAG